MSFDVNMESLVRAMAAGTDVSVQPEEEASFDKYKLTDTKKVVDGKTLYQIEAIADFGDVKKGQKGGYVEKLANLDQKGNCWIEQDASVYGDAQVKDNALVGGKAIVKDNAIVKDEARVGIGAVFGNAAPNEPVISGKAVIEDKGSVRGRAEISGEARVAGNALVNDHAKVQDFAVVKDNAQVLGDAVVKDSAFVSERARLSGHGVAEGSAEIRGDAHIRDEASVKDARLQDSAKGLSPLESAGRATAAGVLAFAHPVIGGIALKDYAKRQNGHADDITVGGATHVNGGSYDNQKEMIGAVRDARAKEAAAVLGIGKKSSEPTKTDLEK